MTTDTSTQINYTGRFFRLRRHHRCCHGMFRQTQSLYAIKLPRLVGDKTNTLYLIFSSYLKESVFFLHYKMNRKISFRKIISAY